MKLKYIITTNMNCEEVPFLFGVMTDHKVAAGDSTVVGAGFCELFVDSNDCIDVNCYGESIGLNIKSRPEDTGIVRAAFKEGDFY